MANGFDFYPYVPVAPRRNPALDQWGNQGMMGPRPAPPPYPQQMGVPQGMNPYDLGPPPEMAPRGVAPAAPADQGPPMFDQFRPPGQPLSPTDPGYYEEWRQWYKDNPISPEVQDKLLRPDGGSIGETYIPDFEDARTEGVAKTPVGSLGGIMGLLRGLGRGAGGGGVGALPPPSSRYSMGIPKTDFIYTNPVAAQQATAALQARLGYEQQQDQGYRQYQIAQQQAQQQAQQSRDLQAQRSDELAKDRALQREGFASSERSAAVRGGYGQSEFDMRERARKQELADNDLVVKRARFMEASSLSAYLNNPNISEMEKRKNANPLVVHQGPDGIWRPSVPDPDAAQAQPQAGGVPTIGQIQGAVSGSTPPAAAAPGAPMFPGPPPPPAPPPPGPSWWQRMLTGQKGDPWSQETWNFRPQ